MSERKTRIKKKAKLVFDRAREINDRVMSINDMHGYILKDTPYISGKAGMAYELAFFISYGTARLKNRLRRKREEREKPSQRD